METEPSTSDRRIEDATYYHGSILRITSEALIEKDGDFLVRDSISSPGDYVLTAQHNGEAMHFQVNRSKENDAAVFHFEEESFSSVEGLIEFYISHQRPITRKSGCIIRTPVVKSKKVDQAKLKQKELEASYMHILRPDAKQLNADNHRLLMQRACFNRAASQRPNIYSSQQDSSCQRPPTRVPPLPAALANRPLPLPIRVSREEEDQNDYDEMDYEAMLPVAETKPDMMDARRARSPFPTVIGNFHRQFRSCTNLTTSSGRNSPLNQAVTTAPSHDTKQTVRKLKMSREKPALPPRPTNLTPVKPKFYKAKSQLNVKIDDAPEAARNEEVEEEEAEYDEPRPAVSSWEKQRMKQEKPCEKRLSGGSDSSCGQSSTSSALTSDSAYDDICRQSVGTSTETDSGFYSSPSPPSERSLSGIFNLQRIDELRSQLLNASPKNLSLMLTAEDAELMSLSKHGMENGLRLVLMPAGLELRKLMINRSRLTTLTVLVSLLIKSNKANRTVMSQLLGVWVQVAAQLYELENLFTFVNIIDALNWWMKSLVSQEILKASSTETQKELNRLVSLRDELVARTLQPAASQLLLPFLQPLLEILCSGNSQFLQELTYSSQLDSLFFWMENARKWTQCADEVSENVQKLFSPDISKESEWKLSTAGMQLLFEDAQKQEAINYATVIEHLHKLAQNLCTTL